MIASENEDIIFDPLLERGDRPTSSSSVHRPLQRSSQVTNPLVNGSLNTVVADPNIGKKTSTSSEDLLREYGLDFGQLSVAQSNTFQNTGTKLVNSVYNPPPRHLPPMDLFADLDPLNAVTPLPGIGKRPTIAPAARPVAPPRTKRPQTAAAQNWTTFE